MKKLEQVIDHFGDVLSLAKALGVSRPAIYQWRSSGAIPPMRALQIEIITNGQFKAHELNPSSMPNPENTDDDDDPEVDRAA